MPFPQCCLPMCQEDIIEEVVVTPELVYTAAPGQQVPVQPH